MRSTNKAEQAIIRRGEPLQLQLPGFLACNRAKAPAVRQGHGSFCRWRDGAIVPLIFARRVKMSLRDRSKHPRQRHPVTLHGVVFDIFWHAEAFQSS
jgi:hypothetical protein